MCLAIPGRVIARDPEAPELAIVDVVGVRRAINVALIDDEPVRPGDWVLIHVGFAMARIDEAEARSTLAALHAMGQILAEEMDALRASEEPG